MKKTLFNLSLISILSLPAIFTYSCSTTTDKIDYYDYQKQYDLFTPELLIKEQVSKNLALSMNNKLIQNIYSIPVNLDTGINCSFSFEIIPNENALKLFVQLYDYENQPIKYSAISSKKEIMNISGFFELTKEQQENINEQYANFSKLDLKGDPSKVSSSFKNFIDIPGANIFVPNPLFNYNFNLDYIDDSLVVTFLLSSKNDYPLKSTSADIFIKKVNGFKTNEVYQGEIDAAYDSVPSFDLSSQLIIGPFIRGYSSSVLNIVELNLFYERLNDSLSVADKIVIPKFISDPTNPLLPFEFDLIIESLDEEGSISIITNIYNKNGELLEPSNIRSKRKSITNFEKASLELLKATMEAYDKFLLYNLESNNENKKILASAISNSSFQNILESIPDFNNFFEISIPKYVNKRVVNEVFTFKVKEPITIKDTIRDDLEGSISFNLDIEYITKQGTWELIRPSSNVVIFDKGLPSFSKTKTSNTIIISGFLTNKLFAVNNLFEIISDKITLLGPDKMKILISKQSLEDFNSPNFNGLWESLSTNDNDQLGIPFKNKDDFPISVKYTFLKNKNNTTIINETLIGGIRTKIITIKAVVCSSIDLNYEYEFINKNNILKPVFEFKFAIQLENN